MCVSVYTYSFETSLLLFTTTAARYTIAERRVVLNKSVGVALQLCSGGSVTELVKARLQHGHRMDESVIAHILKETMKVKTDHIGYRFIINICIGHYNYKLSERLFNQFT